MTQEEELAQLKEQLREVLEQFSAVAEQLSQVQERERHLLEQLSAEQAENHTLQAPRASAHKRIEELEKQKTPPPAFVKANVVKPPEDTKSRARSAMPSIIVHGVGKSRRGSWSIRSSTARCVQARWEGEVGRAVGK
jgi:septal ring factor EnvC (AmiA/AmiB activator)